KPMALRLLALGGTQGVAHLHRQALHGRGPQADRCQQPQQVGGFCKRKMRRQVSRETAYALRGRLLSQTQPLVQRSKPRAASRAVVVAAAQSALSMAGDQRAVCRTSIACPARAARTAKLVLTA